MDWEDPKPEDATEIAVALINARFAGSGSPLRVYDAAAEEEGEDLALFDLDPDDPARWTR